MSLAGFWCLAGLIGSAAAQTSSGMVPRVLFLGDNALHRPAERFRQLEPVLSGRGIDLVYTDDMRDVNSANLAGFDGLAVYANITQISPEQETALLDFVSGGGGLIAIHCASFCFHNSPKYIELVGAQFQRHGTGVFQETILRGDHPVMQGLQPIESWDETYVHTKHNPDRVVLSERRDDEGAEPWTWVRTHGQGRVFYTAWGHDQRTWGHAGFQDLIENGVRWACANSPAHIEPKEGLKPFEYVESPAPLPNYTPHADWGTQGEPIRTMQQPLSPEESLKHYVRLDGFEQSLFAAEPDIVNPLWLAWDERGRLWIAESIDYPNEMQPEGQGRDRLRILEDTDGDGKADRFKVFAEGLSIPTSFVFANGGVIVIHSGRTELLKDTNGDDRADVSEILFEGWGTRDTHAAASNLRYGFDNWIWGTVGYSGFRGEVGGKEIRFGQGIFRFKPDGSALEFVRSSNNNTWGLGITEDNVIIGSTANGNASMYMPMANRYYEAVNGWSASRLESIADSQRFWAITDKVRQVDWHGQYTAGSGSAIYTARQFPKRFWNRAQFVAEPTGHLLGLFLLEKRGADYIARNARNMLASDDEWSSPIYAEVGPDGALWMVDWYNYIIQHNPTPRGFETGRGNAYETPLRDKTHGRIYRVTHREGSHRSSLDLAEASPAKLVETLTHDNLLWRLHAQRLLVERGELDVADRLHALIGESRTDALGLAPGAIHGLWTLQGLGAMSGSNDKAATAAVRAMKHSSAGARKASADVLPATAAARDALLEAGLLSDDDAQVRKSALLALSRMPASEQAGKAVFAMMREPRNSEDRWIPDAATAAAARHDSGFLQAALTGYQAPAASASVDTASNLIRNPSFEDIDNDRPGRWRSVTHSGQGEFETAAAARTGDRSVKISSERGGDLSWAARVEVTPQTEYKLTGWIKTENVQALGGALGALLNVHELQDPEGGATAPVKGTQDWTQVQLNFNSGDMTRLTVNCLFGGWGRATGSAWFDDIELKPAPGAALEGAMGRVLRVVTTHYAQRGPVESIVPTLLSLEQASPVVATALLDGLASGWPESESPNIDDSDAAKLRKLMQALPESDRDRLLLLAQRWNQPSLFGESVNAIIASLKEQISGGSLSAEERGSAAQRLVGLSDQPETIDWLLGQINLLTPPDQATGLVRALSVSEDDDTGDQILNHWERFTPAVRRNAIAVMMRRVRWAMSLLGAVQDSQIAKTDLAPEHWSQLRQNPNRFVSRRAERLSEQVAGVSADREEIVNQLLPLAKQKGDIKRGAEVYEANCAVCHIFNGKGGMVGPDLTGIGARDRSEVLLDIIDPNRSVEANYRLWTVATKDGELYSGRLEAETQTTVEILDTTAQKHVIQRKNIESLEPSALSIMPIGFEALPPDDIKALLEYMAQPH